MGVGIRRTLEERADGHVERLVWKNSLTGVRGGLGEEASARRANCPPLGAPLFNAGGMVSRRRRYNQQWAATIPPSRGLRRSLPFRLASTINTGV